MTLPDRELAHRLLHQMLRIRRFEERCGELYGETKIRGFLHLYIGEEAVAVGVMDHLTEDEPVLATYREHGHALAKGVSARAVMAEMYGKQEGCSRGRGGSMHLFDESVKFYGGNAIVAGGIPLAVGMALADKLRGRNRASVVFFGEGAMAEGEFHESANLAALWELPVLFVCENNRYAMGTALDRTESETNLAVKAASYEMPAWTVDGMDVLAVHDATRRALAVVRSGSPVFLEAQTYRFRPHSMFDPERYRERDEVRAWRDRDPIDLLVATLRANDLLDDDELEQLGSSVTDEIEDAVAFAEAGTWEPVEDLTRFVYRREVVR
jgi:pyruvate dehydrogenase E1 component alpha subunit